MARSSLLLLAVLVATSSCLVLGDTEFEEPVREPPELIPVTPTTELITLVDPQGTEPLAFDAVLRSQDAGDDLQAVLLLNYGVPSLAGQPWQDDVTEDTISAGPNGIRTARPLSLQWFPQLTLGRTHECKRVTMVVSHNFARRSPYEWCPIDASDVARLTWFVALCETLAECTFDDCVADEPDGGYVYCPEDVLTALSQGGP